MEKMTPGLEKLNRRGIFPCDNDLRYTAKITEEFIKKEKVKTV